jgi:hypothetical protein
MNLNEILRSKLNSFIPYKQTITVQDRYSLFFPKCDTGLRSLKTYFHTHRKLHTFIFNMIFHDKKAVRYLIMSTFRFCNITLLQVLSTKHSTGIFENNEIINPEREKNRATWEDFQKLKY